MRDNTILGIAFLALGIFLPYFIESQGYIISKGWFVIWFGVAFCFLGFLEYIELEETNPFRPLIYVVFVSVALFCVLMAFTSIHNGLVWETAFYISGSFFIIGTGLILFWLFYPASQQDTWFGTWLSKRQRQTQAELSKIDAEVAADDVVIAQAQHAITRLPSETYAVESGHYTAAGRGIPPETYPAYITKELEAKVLHQIEVFKMQIESEKERLQAKVKFDTARDFAIKQVHEILGIQQQLHRLAEAATQIRNNNISEEEKEEKLDAVSNAVNYLYQYYDERFRPRPTGEDVDGEERKRTRRTRSRKRNR